MNTNPFGKYVADIRVKAKRSLRDVARELEVSPTYLWDVEEGRRNPPSPDKISKLAEILGVNPHHLRRLASVARKAVELSLTEGATTDKDNLALLLARRWEGLSDEETRQLLDQLNCTEDSRE